MPESDNDLDSLVADLRGPVALALRRASMFELIGVVERAAELLASRDDLPTSEHELEAIGLDMIGNGVTHDGESRITLERVVPRGSLIATRWETPRGGRR